MVDEEDLKHWRDAGHVARRTLDGIKGEIIAGKHWNEVIDSAERFIRRHGGKPAFPVTISVNDMAAHYTTNTLLEPPDGIEGEMVFEKGDGGNHTEQIRAAEEARDAAIEKMHPGTPWHEVGAAAEQVAKDAGFEPIRNLCGHQLERWDLHAGTSIPSYACGSNNPGFKGSPEIGGIYAIEPFNTTGGSGMVENVPPVDSSNILRVTGDVRIRKALAKGKIKPLGATMARYIEERYSTLPFAERWAYPLLEKPFQPY